MKGFLMMGTYGRLSKHPSHIVLPPGYVGVPFVFHARIVPLYVRKDFEVIETTTVSPKELGSGIRCLEVSRDTLSRNKFSQRRSKTSIPGPDCSSGNLREPLMASFVKCFVNYVRTEPYIPISPVGIGEAGDRAPAPLVVVYKPKRPGQGQNPICSGDPYMAM